MSVFDFKSQRTGAGKLTEDDIERIKNLPIVNYEDIQDINNTEKYNWVQVVTGNEYKYGRDMYCLKTGIRRTQTMGEFYGNSTVD